MGTGHATYLAHHVDGASLVAVCEPQHEAGQKLIDDLAIGATLWSDVETMLDSTPLDGLIIASPDRFHAWTIGVCLDRGLPALCEKPLAENLRDAHEVYQRHSEMESTLGRPLIHLGFMRRFDAAYQKTKAIIDSGELGEVLYVNASTRNVHSEGITSSQLLTNIAVHEIDIFRWLLKSEWDTLVVNYPRATRHTPEGVKDPVVLTGTMDNSVFVVADVFAHNHYGYDVRTEITFERGVVRIGVFGDIAVTRDHTYVTEPSGPMKDNWIPRFENAYVAELVAWTGTLRDESHPDLATVEDGVRALEVLATLVNP
jgi:myo-inositol 2-dehydrogenase/D-chiro-inositol 1-dehydrogenase